MTDFAYVIPGFWLAVLLATYLKYGRWANPISVLVGWWCLWLYVANLDLTGVYVPSAYTQQLYLLMLGSVTLGALCAPRSVSGSASQENERVVRKWTWMLLVLVPVGLVVLALFSRAWTNYLGTGVTVGRSQIFESSILFPNGYVQRAYVMFFRPFLLTSCIAGVALYMTAGHKRLLIVGTVLFILDSLMMLGRKDLYWLLLLGSFVFYVLMYRDAPRRLYRARRYVTLGGLGLSAIVINITLLRVGGVLDVQEIVQQYVLRYHTLGFTLFDLERLDAASRLNTHLTLGRSTLGGLEQFLMEVLSFVDSSARAAARETGSYMHAFRHIGTAPEGYSIQANAFNTLLYTLYIDGRQVFVVLLPLIYGWLTTRHYAQWMKQRRIHSLMVLCLLATVGLLGIFNSPLEGQALWVAALTVLFINRVRLPVPVLTRGSKASPDAALPGDEPPESSRLPPEAHATST
jgi:oligosaccharide repeat unit polymerase